LRFYFKILGTAKQPVDFCREIRMLAFMQKNAKIEGELQFYLDSKILPA